MKCRTKFSMIWSLHAVYTVYIAKLFSESGLKQPLFFPLTSVFRKHKERAYFLSLSDFAICFIGTSGSLLKMTLWILDRQLWVSSTHHLRFQKCESNERTRLLSNQFQTFALRCSSVVKNHKDRLQYKFQFYVRLPSLAFQATLYNAGH